MLKYFCLSVMVFVGSVLNAQEIDVSTDENSQAIRVTTVDLSSVLTKPINRVSATVFSRNDALISANASGDVVSVNVSVGDHLEKGTIIVKLDCRASELAQKATRDHLQLANKEFVRSQKLNKSNTIAEQAYNQAQSNKTQANIRFQQANLAVEHCVVKAPFSGVVTERFAQLGALLNPSSPVIQLMEVDSLEAKVHVDLTQIDSLEQNDTIQFVDGTDAYSIKLRTILPLVDSSNNQRTAIFVFQDTFPLAGTSGNVQWSSSQRVFPVDLQVQRDGLLGYFVVDGNKARFIMLPNAKLGHPSIILTPQEDPSKTSIIKGGRHRVVDGSVIEVIKVD